MLRQRKIDELKQLQRYTVYLKWYQHKNYCIVLSNTFSKIQFLLTYDFLSNAAMLLLAK